MHACATSNLHVVALKRSGHHAFIAWLCEWKDRPTLFINNVLPSQPPRFGSLSIYRGETIGKEDLETLDGNVHAALSQSRYDVALNFEGRSSRSIQNFETTLMRSWGLTAGRRVLFFRDPLNNFASLAKRVPDTSFKHKLKCLSQVFRFCEYMDQVRNDSSSPRPFFDEVVLFSRWQLDEAYRQQLAMTFGLRGSGLKGEMSRFGGGSSFSGLAFNPARDYEKLFSRWCEMENDAFFISLFLNDRIFEAIESYYDRFGEHEPVERTAPLRLREKARTHHAALRLRRVWIDRFERYQARLDRAECEPITAVRRLSRLYVKAMLGASVSFSVAKQFAMSTR